MTLSYSTLFSRVLNKINDPKELSLNKNDLLEIYTERLHSVVGKPRVRRLFSSLSLDDEIQEMPDEEFSWKESYQFKEKDLPDGKYAFTYEVTDITGKSTMSDVAFLNLKNGEIKPEL